VLLHITEDKEAFMSKSTILNKIMNNERYGAILQAREELMKKYGNITIAGGCFVDCLHDKDFYDIDCFISYKDLKDEWKKQITNRRKNTHIVEVFRDTVDEYDIDIVVVDYSVSKHIRRFDQIFKQIWLDDNGLHITKGAVNDIAANRITVGVLNGPAIYFRVLRSARKYNMVIDDMDFFLMENFMSTLDYFILPKKYQHMKREFMPYRRPNRYLGRMIFKYSKLYWNTDVVYIPSWSLLKSVFKPYMALINWKNIM
jgi:hypothetical protein